MDIARKVIEALSKKNLSLSLAESITGGRASSLLTGVPGSSKVFSLGAIVYSLQAKQRLFSLSLDKLVPVQGVSEEVARILAVKVRSFSSTDYGAAVVGFAGPDAPKGKKGLIWLAVASAGHCRSRLLRLRGDRNRIQERAASALLEFIYKEIKG